MLLLSTQLCCAEADSRLVAPEEMEIVFRVPNVVPTAFTAAPSGTLFLAAGDSLYRSAAHSLGTEWSAVAHVPEVPTHLYAPSDEEVFAVTRECWALFRWSEGTWSRIDETALFTRASWKEGQPCARYYSVHGSSANRVFAVGQYFVVASFDGVTWTSEESLPPSSTSLNDRYRGVLWSVAVAESSVVVGGTLDLLQRSDRGTWITLLSVAGLEDSIKARQCVPTFVARSSVGYVAGSASRACAVRIEGDQIETLREPVTWFRGVFVGAHFQPRGLTLLWTDLGEVLAVDGRATQAIRGFDLRRFSGAVAVDGWLFVAGLTAADESIVSRLRTE